jgi:hypothetical protein
VGGGEGGGEGVVAMARRVILGSGAAPERRCPLSSIKFSFFGNDRNLARSTL